MRKVRIPNNLQVALANEDWLNLVIQGFEDDDKKKKDDDSEDKSKKDDDSDDDSDDSDDDDSDDKDDKGEKGNNDALKSALQKERAARKKAERENKALAKFKTDADNKDKSETDQAKDEAKTEKEKNKRLAVKLKDTSIDNVITKLATKLKFRDLDDALKMVDRDDIDVEQDEDEPADIEVDEDTVEAALKALAKKKPHLIVAEGQEEKSGSKFNGKKKTDKEVDEEALRGKYPALQRSSHNG